MYVFSLKFGYCVLPITEQKVTLVKTEICNGPAGEASLAMFIHGIPI